MTEDVIIKLDLNKILFKHLHHFEMVYDWWYTPNNHFNGSTPEEVYQSGYEGRKSVKDYLTNLVK